MVKIVYVVHVNDVINIRIILLYVVFSGNYSEFILSLVKRLFESLYQKSDSCATKCTDISQGHWIQAFTSVNKWNLYPIC